MITQAELKQIQNWITLIRPTMQLSPSSYTKGRKELAIRHKIQLLKAGQGEAKIEKTTTPGSDLIETIGEKLLPGFDHALLLIYPKGSGIKKHADSPAYAKGAATLNISGSATLNLYDWGGQKTETIKLTEGGWVQFDNKQPHEIEPVPSERICCCYFRLKQKPTIQQLTLF